MLKKSKKLSYYIGNKKITLHLILDKRFKLISFPCEIGLKRYVVYNEKEFVENFNHINRFSDDGVYNSIYSFSNISNKRKMRRIDYKNANVDKICADLDIEDYEYNPIYCYINMVALHTFLEDFGIQHTINFSGNGYHVYIGVDSTFIENEEKDDYIKELFNVITQITGVKICESCYWKPVTRIIRTTGSYYTKPAKKKEENKITDKNKNTTIKKKNYLEWIKKSGFSNRYCTNLNHKDIHSGYVHIYNKSLVPETKVVIFCNYRVLLNKLNVISKEIKVIYFDETMKDFEYKNIDGEEITDVFKLFDSFGISESEIPICIKLLMKNKYMRYMERFIFILYLCKLNLSKNEIREVLKIVLSKQKLHHTYEEEEAGCGGLPNYIFDCYHNKNIDYDVSCGSIRNIGYCTKICQKKDLFYDFRKENKMKK